MKVLITGSTGFVGRYLVPKLILQGHSVIEITIEPEVSEKLYGESTSKILVSENQAAFTCAVEKANPEVVIHLASYLTSSDDYHTLQKLLSTNIIFLCRLLDALKKTDLNLFVNTGTFAEYYKGDGVFNPAYLYSATKTASRSFLDYFSNVYNFKQTTVVPYTIYGGNDSQKKIIDIIYDSINSEKPIDSSPGEQILDFIHVDDVADFYIHLLNNCNQLPNKSNFQLGTGNGHTIKQLATIIEKLSSQKTNLNWGAKPYRQTDVMYAVANPDFIIGKTNWKPNIDLEMGIRMFLNNRRKL
ncbi:MAG: NAD(P)-dependent oxidoreductase [Candidatus Atribacteria bacterium]|nr:NAD(P)-dependent oxidoreductase [Candidatus Atribacteria bacterium]